MLDFFWLLSHRSLRLLSLFQFIFLSDVQIESLSLVNPPAHWLFPLSPLFWYWAGEWRLCFWFQLLCFPGGASDKESACQCRRHKRYRFEPWVRKIPWRRKWQPTPVFLPVEFHGQRSLAGYTVVSKRVGHDWSNLAHCVHRFKISIWFLFISSIYLACFLVFLLFQESFNSNIFVIPSLVSWFSFSHASWDFPGSSYAK